MRLNRAAAELGGERTWKLATRSELVGIFEVTRTVLKPLEGKLIRLLLLLLITRSLPKHGGMA